MLVVSLLVFFFIIREIKKHDLFLFSLSVATKLRYIVLLLNERKYSFMKILNKKWEFLFFKIERKEQ